MKNMHTFNVRTLKAEGGPCDGEYFGLPWPCYGTPEAKHPGSPNLYQTDKHVMDGGGNFRANFGVEKDGVNLLAEDGSHSLGAEITTGYPEFTADMVKQLGWWDDLTEAEKAEAEGKNWKTDLSGGIQRVVMKHGCHPFGNAKARAVVWNFPDPGFLEGIKTTTKAIARPVTATMCQARAGRVSADSRGMMRSRAWAASSTVASRNASLRAMARVTGVSKASQLPGAGARRVAR